MLISREVEIVLHNTMIKHYENLGYKIPRYIDKKGRLCVRKGTKIKVKIEDLTFNSIVPIQCFCDYCLEEGKETIITKDWRNYIESRKIINKDCCTNCQPKKSKESCNIQYGVDHTSQLGEVKEKLKQTNLKKYGVSSYPKTKEYDEKSKQTRLDRYGVEYSIQNKESREKMQETMVELYGVEYYAKIDECKEKTKLTCLKKYGKEYHTQVEVCKEKSKITCLKKYGVSSYAKTKEFKEDNSGENNTSWKGGITPLHEYLRNKINEWKQDSFKKYNYKCDITNIHDTKLIIHHHYNFSDILQETMYTLHLPIYDEISKYTEIELKLIKDKCLELHYKYGLGVCLCEEEHKLFHSIYGKKNNTKEQYKEFKQMRLNQIQYEKKVS